MKQYLGDGVYIDVEHGIFKLTTENGIEATNTIYLELDVWRALLLYARHINAALVDINHMHVPEP
jgi:hypothetical protein